MPKVPKFAKESAVTGLVTLLFLALAELALRLIYADVDPKSALGGPHIAYEFDHDTLVSLKPSATGTFVRSSQNGGQAIEWRTNAHAFRGPPLRRSSDLRVIVYGDSNIQAVFSPLEHTFPYRLEKELERLTGATVEVINAGLIGSGPDQNFVRLMREVDQYDPDIVVFHVFADNDFGDIIRNRIFELDSNGELVRRKSAMAPLHSDRWNLGQTFLQKYLSSFYLTLAAVRVSEILFPEDPPDDDDLRRLDLKMKEQFSVYAKRNDRAYSHFDDTYDLDVAIRPDSQSARSKKALMEGILRAVRDYLSEKGVELVVLAQPSSHDLTRNLSFDYSDLSKFPGYSPRNLTSPVEKSCSRLGLECISLFDVFSADDPGKFYFKDDDNHWNDSGQALAAKVTAKTVFDRFLTATPNR